MILCCEKSWGGFEVDYLKPGMIKQNNGAQLTAPKPIEIDIDAIRAKHDAESAERKAKMKEKMQELMKLPDLINPWENENA